MKKVINPEAEEIQKRFFTALQSKIKEGEITGLQGFCKEYNLNRTKYQKLKTSLEKPAVSGSYKIIDIDALMYICKDYNVSAEWLLLGRGRMKN